MFPSAAKVLDTRIEDLEGSQITFGGRLLIGPRIWNAHKSVSVLLSWYAIKRRCCVQKPEGRQFLVGTRFSIVASGTRFKTCPFGSFWAAEGTALPIGIGNTLGPTGPKSCRTCRTFGTGPRPYIHVPCLPHLSGAK